MMAYVLAEIESIVCVCVCVCVCVSENVVLANSLIRSSASREQDEIVTLTLLLD